MKKLDCGCVELKDQMVQICPVHYSRVLGSSTNKCLCTDVQTSHELSEKYGIPEII